jgi:hypothetical protein
LIIAILDSIIFTGGDNMKLLDAIYNLLSHLRDQKRQEVYRLRWQKVRLEKQLDDLKRLKKEQEKQAAEG